VFQSTGDLETEICFSGDHNFLSPFFDFFVFLVYAKRCRCMCVKI